MSLAFAIRYDGSFENRLYAWLFGECETLHEGNGLPAEHIRNSSVVFLLHDAMRVDGTRKKKRWFNVCSIYGRFSVLLMLQLMFSLNS